MFQTSWTCTELAVPPRVSLQLQKLHGWAGKRPRFDPALSYNLRWPRRLPRHEGGPFTEDGGWLSLFCSWTSEVHSSRLQDGVVTVGEEVDLHRLQRESGLSQRRWPTPYSSQLEFIAHLTLSLSEFLHCSLPLPLAHSSLLLGSSCMHNNLPVHTIHVGGVTIINKYLTLTRTNTFGSMSHCMYV